MKSSVFSWRAFRMGMKRTRTAGLIYSVALFAITMIPTLIMCLEHIFHRGSGLDKYIMKLSYSDAGVLLLAFFAAPVLTYVQFSFLNKRNSSDFFHSLPVKRTALFSGLSLANAAWLFIGMAASMLGMTLAFLVTPDTCIDASFYLYGLIVFVASLLFQQGVALGMALTGTFLSNVVASSLILFAPRLIIGVFSDLCNNILKIVTPINDTVWFLDYNTNLVFGVFGAGYRDVEWYSVVYSFVLAVVYFLLGMLVFRRRKSETAELSAQNGVMQCIIRTLLAFLVTLPALYSMIVDDDFELAVCCFAFAVIVYFAYEIITRRSFRTFGKAAWQLVFLIALDLVFLIVPLTIRSSVLRSTPVYENVAAVYIEDARDIVANGNEIEAANMAGIRITDEEIMSFLSDEAQDDAENMRDFTYLGGDPVTVRFEMKDGTDVTRRIFLYQYTMRTLSEKLFKCNALTDALILKPDAASVTEVSIISDIAVDKESSADIYSTFLREYESLPRSDKLAISAENCFKSLAISVTADGKTSLYSINAFNMPDTFNAIVNADKAKKEPVYNAFMHGDVIYFDGWFNYNGIDSRFNADSRDGKLMPESQETLDWIRKNAFAEPKGNEGVIALFMNIEYIEDGEVKDGSFCVSVPASKDAAWFKNIVYGESEMYSEEDIADAVDVVIDEIISYGNCNIKSVRYLSDEESRKEREKDNTGGDYIVLISEFSTNLSNDRESELEPDCDYIRTWTLNRTNAGKWKIVGYTEG